MSGLGRPRNGSSYKLLKMAGQKNFDGYNQRIREAKEAGTPIMNPHAQPPIPLEEIPYIIIIIDELLTC